ncbi:mobilisation protein (MobC) [Mariniphaga anaerophila]|uniref:Mobilisation protein (MobC) n=1 Tax=Mariniphaga anaerophila TaxID=1484053 RepID=A0A1M4SUR6_9BACT|nr:plasmid mobilization relaxosome protein MobC [Mariniphaga anaerophila]SHE35939.1 mobilisation protein (MobC) [Mariniphaga anaerophila]
MRPALSENEKRSQKLIIRVNPDEKLRIKSLTRSGGYPCMSDFIRNRIFRRLDKKTITLDNETSRQLKEMDYELNKIGVNLNQLSKRMNSFVGCNIGDNDRQLLRLAFEMMTRCLAFLQKHLR